MRRVGAGDSPPEAFGGGLPELEHPSAGVGELVRGETLGVGEERDGREVGGLRDIRTPAAASVPGGATAPSFRPKRGGKNRDSPSRVAGPGARGGLVGGGREIGLGMGMSVPVRRALVLRSVAMSAVAGRVRILVLIARAGLAVVGGGAGSADGGWVAGFLTPALPASASSARQHPKPVEAARTSSTLLSGA